MNLSLFTTRKSRYAMLLGIGVVAAVLLVGVVSANHAGKTYMDDYGQYVASAQSTAKTAGSISYSKTVLEQTTAALLQSQQQMCSAITTDTKATQANAVPRLNKFILLRPFGLVVGSYRQANHLQATTTLPAQQASMLTHLQRLQHTCTVLNLDEANQLIYIRSQPARDALQSTCTNGTTTYQCLEPANNKAYGDLYIDVVNYAKAEYKLYSNQCVHPDLQAVCTVFGTYWKDAVASNTALYNAYITGGDIAAADPQDKIIADTKLLCDALKTSQPKLYATVITEQDGLCLDATATSKIVNQALNDLVVADEQAAAAAAQQILKA